jgi:type VI secretion system protein ImpH
VLEVDGETAAEVTRVEITPAFMGLLGVNGTLPTVYTEQIAQRELYQKDFAARGFMDVFSHRAVSMFYAAWKKNRLHLQYETDRKNRFLPMALALAGVGQHALHDRLEAGAGGVDDESLAFFSGALQQRSLSAHQLEQLLARYLKVPVKIEQFCGRWYHLPKAALTSLGLGNGVLGRNALAGERVWQRDLRVKVSLGPLGHVRFRRFLPGAPGTMALRKMLTLLSGVSLEYEINLVLKAEAVEGSELNSARSPLAGRLGWDTYLQTRTHNIDRCDVRYDVHAAVAT